MYGRGLAKLAAAEQHRVLVAQQRWLRAVVRVGDDLRSRQRRLHDGLGGVRRGRPLELLGEAALGAVGPAEPVVGLLRAGGQGWPGLVPAVDAVLAKGVEYGRALLEECLDGLGGADGLALGGEELGEEPAGVLGEGEDEEGLVLHGEGLLCLGGGREESVDSGEYGRPHCEGRLLDAAGVEPEQEGQEDVEEDGARHGVWLRRLGCGAGDRHAAVQAVGEEVCVPLAADEARSDDRAQVRERGKLRRVLRGEDQGAQGEAEVQLLLRHRGGEEVRVDVGLGGVVAGQLRVELGDAEVELGGARDELGLRCGGRAVSWWTPLGGSSAPGHGKKNQRAVCLVGKWTCARG